MRILLLSDTHIRSTSPVGRIDNFLETQKKKWKFILSQHVDCIIQAGDLFDNSRPSYELLNEFILLFKEYNIPLYIILGQHDLLMRNKDINKTVIGILQKTGLVDIIPYDGIQIGNVEIYGKSYGEK